MAVGLAGLACCDCCNFAAAVAMAAGFDAAAVVAIVVAPIALGFAAADFAEAAGAGVGVRVGVADIGGKNSTKSVGKKPVLPLIVPLVHPPGSPWTRSKRRPKSREHKSRIRQQRTQQDQRTRADRTYLDGNCEYVSLLERNLVRI
jgi:hypothetical protein